MLKISIVVALFLVSAGIVSTGVGTVFAQNDTLGQSGNSNAEQTIEQLQ
jgi:hypothetical protein